MSKDLVVKHNDFIEAGYNLNPIQIRVLTKLASMIHSEDEDFKLYEFRAQDLLKELQIGAENYTVLRDAINGFFGKPINIIKVKSNLVLNLLSSAEYFPDGRIELEYSPKMKPYLLQLKANFTRYSAMIFMNLRSKYAQRIYELLKQYETAGERKIELAYLREIFYLQDKYKKYGDFKKRVIESAIREINEKTDIEISYTEFKKGKRVHALIFKIKSQKTTPKKDPLESKPLFDIPDDDLLATLKKEAKVQRSDAPGLLDDLDILVTQDKVIISAEDPIHIDRLGTLKEFIEEFFTKAGKTVDYK